MFILPPNCIVPSATSLTMRPVFPSFLYFISHTPCDRSGRHQIDTFESTGPGQNWALTEWPVNVDSGRLRKARRGQLFFLCSHFRAIIFRCPTNPTRYVAPP